jgi:hypothetical protein
LDQIVNFLIWKIGVQPQGYVFLSMVSSFSLVFFTWTCRRPTGHCISDIFVLLSSLFCYR